MTPLRQRFSEDLQLRNYAAGTIRAYIEHGSRLATHFQRSPADLTEEDVRSYLVYLVRQRLEPLQRHSLRPTVLVSRHPGPGLGRQACAVCQAAQEAAQRAQS